MQPSNDYIKSIMEAIDSTCGMSCFEASCGLNALYTFTVHFDDNLHNITFNLEDELVAPDSVVAAFQALREQTR